MIVGARTRMVGGIGICGNGLGVVDVDVCCASEATSPRGRGDE